jgi:propanol-preferring alcohol dehydrogenase
LIQAYNEACKSIKKGGRIIAIALPKENLSISVIDLIIREIQLIGSMVGTRKDLQEALELAKLRKIRCKVTKCKLEDINEVFENNFFYSMEKFLFYYLKKYCNIIFCLD